MREVVHLINSTSFTSVSPDYNNSTKDSHVTNEVKFIIYAYCR